jgi:uncharacterized SAM-binding protein YcdF (DUF218 family)
MVSQLMWRLRERGMDNVFFVVSKLFWFLVRPENLPLLLTMAGIIALLRHRRRGALWLLLLGVGLMLVIGALPLGYLALRPLEARFAPGPEVADPAGIIILGGGEESRLTADHGQFQTNEAGERFLQALVLARKYPQAKLIFTGGSGAVLDPTVSGADVARKIFAAAGIPPGRLMFESRSRNTWENAVNTLELLVATSETTEGPWILLTSAFHMPRSVGVFCAAGWRDVVPYPVDYRARPAGLEVSWDYADHLDDLNTGVREWIGLLVYRITGKTGALFPSGC